MVPKWILILLLLVGSVLIAYQIASQRHTVINKVIIEKAPPSNDNLLIYDQSVLNVFHNMFTQPDPWQTAMGAFDYSQTQAIKNYFIKNTQTNT